MLFLPSAFLPWKWSLAGLLPAGACVWGGSLSLSEMLPWWVLSNVQS